jgi:GDP-mannose 6-dehydrogenase
VYDDVAMRVAVYGLGYVGSVTATCLADAGHDVIGVDVHAGKVDAINSGHSPIVEAGLDERVRAVVAAGTLRATTDPADAAACEVAVLCIGTPSDASGAPDVTALERVCRAVGQRFAPAIPYPVVVVRSTVLPGTLRTRLQPALEAGAGREVGDRLGLCVVPEFLREGSGVADFYNPPMTLVGAVDPESFAVAEALLGVEGAPRVRVDPDVAVMVKYASNAYHALKVAFANEVDELCDRHGVDGRAVMEWFCADRKLNVSERYLRPGFAFGGSCLPKDLRALLHAARHRDATLPVLEAILASNQLRVQRAVERVVASGARRVAVVGLSFKPGTDDLRESPLVALVETLLGKGFAVRVFDPSLSLERLTGSNQRFIERAIPHLEALLAPSLEAALEDAEVVVLGHVRAASSPAAELPIRPGQIVLDLARSPEGAGAP